MSQSYEITATDRIFEIEQDLHRIRALIENARLMLEREEATQRDADKEQAAWEISVQLENMEDTIQNLDQLRLDLLDGTQEYI